MDLRYTDDEQRSAPSCASGSPTCCPGLGPEPDRDDWDARRAWDTGWQRMLFDAGYAGINWPKEYGGRGATPTEHLIFIEETERARAPYVGMNFVGLLHAGPDAHRRGVRRAEGLPPARHPQGRARLVPGLLRAQRRLRPRQPAHPAVRDGDDYVHQRPEDLDQLRPRRRLLRDARAHRPRGPEAQRHHRG